MNCAVHFPAQAARPPAGSSCLHFKLSSPKRLPRRPRCQLPAQPEWGLHMSLHSAPSSCPGIVTSALSSCPGLTPTWLFSRPGVAPMAVSSRPGIAPTAPPSYLRQRPSLQHPGGRAWGPRGPPSLPLVHAKPFSSHSPTEGVKWPLGHRTLRF